MRAAKELVNDVDVHARTQETRRRTHSNNGSLHRIGFEPEVLQPVTLWERIRSTLTEELEVAGRQVKGFIVPHWAAGVLLATILGCVGFMYSQISGQRDMLIRLSTQLEERDKHENEYRQEFKTKLNVQQLQIDLQSKELVAVKTVLTPQQLKTAERNIERNH